MIIYHNNFYTDNGPFNTKYEYICTASNPSLIFS